jgi:hypothetical protein
VLQPSVRAITFLLQYDIPDLTEACGGAISDLREVSVENMSPARVHHMAAVVQSIERQLPEVMPFLQYFVCQPQTSHVFQQIVGEALHPTGDVDEAAAERLSLRRGSLQDAIRRAKQRMQELVSSRELTRRELDFVAKLIVSDSAGDELQLIASFFGVVDGGGLSRLRQLQLVLEQLQLGYKADNIIDTLNKLRYCFERSVVFCDALLPCDDVAVWCVSQLSVQGIRGDVPRSAGAPQACDGATRCRGCRPDRGGRSGAVHQTHDPADAQPCTRTPASQGRCVRDAEELGARERLLRRRGSEGIQSSRDSRHRSAAGATHVL